MAPGARSKFGAPMFEAQLFRKQIYCIEESTCDIFGTFQRPSSDSAPGELFPSCPPCDVPACYAIFISGPAAEGYTPGVPGVRRTPCETQHDVTFSR